MLCDFCENTRVHPKPLCILFSDTKGIQWADTDATVDYRSNYGLVKDGNISALSSPCGSFNLLR